ncbi:hypothetical protein INT47_009054 [Mucor saturninus]|uniref:Uncharacterized protein n=1 Tax=Mucor saturninus TaxID=64648 RepID=A0A8H7V7U7_9FUNG|nr:hypothetical protein INT47_009054 [Mucor saturninus]
MSLNSFFHSRKSRSAVAVKQDEGSTFAAQAPQPIYDQFKKPAVVEEPTYCKNSILYYLKPMKKATPAPVKEEQDIDALPCRIRKKTPITSIWDEILDELESDSLYPAIIYVETKFESAQPCRIKKKLEAATAWKNILDKLDPNSGFAQETTAQKRKRQELGKNNRSVRIRTCLNPDILRQSSLLEDCMEDLKEDLCRPLRTKFTLEQSNKILLKMADEVFMLSDNTWLLV